MAILFQLPWMIAAAWFVLIAWAVGQFVWYHTARVAPAPPPARRRDSSSKPAAVKKVPVTALPTGGTPEFLAELGLHNPDNPTEPTGSVYR